jgi:hypothetical protein
MATNLQKYATSVAGVNRRQIFNFPGRDPYQHSLAKLMNKYMILHGIENNHFTADEEVVMQNIFDSISIPD